jgi:hypothetical protein
LAAAPVPAPQIKDSSPLIEKARYFQRDILDKHWMDGLYISIVNVVPPGQKLRHSVDEPGNIIHSGVWTGRYLAGLGYQYAVTKDPWVRQHAGVVLQALRRQQEITGKPGLLARGHVRGHGPVEDWERDGHDSKEWHQGQGKFADYRWYGDVSVDNFNAILYGYAIYYDLGADEAQKKIISYDVDRLMTHVLDHQCRIIDVDNEVTLYGHIGIDPDPSRDEYYKDFYKKRYANRRIPTDGPWRPPLRASLMLLPDLLIAHHVTGKQRYSDFYRKVIDRFGQNPDIVCNPGPYSLEKLARTDHSDEGQMYEALYNLIKYEKDERILAKYRPWVSELWDMNWMEGNALYTYMTLAMLPDYRAPARPGAAVARKQPIEHAAESLKRSLETLRLFSIDRIFRPVMNSIRKDVELNPNPYRDGNGKLTAKVLPINQRPRDNEYEWKGNPYNADAWLKPGVVAMQFACDDPMVAWFVDTAGRLFATLDGWKSWQEVSGGLMGAKVRNIVASKTRTFVLQADTDKGIFLTRDGGMSWRQRTVFETPDFGPASPKEAEFEGKRFRINETGELLLADEPAMKGWWVPRAHSVFVTPKGIVASGPGGAYLTRDGARWTELKLWREQETGAADFVHAYWMGRYYGFILEAPAASAGE